MILQNKINVFLFPGELLIKAALFFCSDEIIVKSVEIIFWEKLKNHFSFIVLMEFSINGSKGKNIGKNC